MKIMFDYRLQHKPPVTSILTGILNAFITSICSTYAVHEIMEVSMHLILRF